MPPTSGRVCYISPLVDTGTEHDISGVDLYLSKGLLLMLLAFLNLLITSDGSLYRVSSSSSSDNVATNLLAIYEKIIPIV